MMGTKNRLPQRVTEKYKEETGQWETEVGIVLPFFSKKVED